MFNAHAKGSVQITITDSNPIHVRFTTAGAITQHKHVSNLSYNFRKHYVFISAISQQIGKLNLCIII